MQGPEGGGGLHHILPEEDEEGGGQLPRVRVERNQVQRRRQADVPFASRAAALAAFGAAVAAAAVAVAAAATGTGAGRAALALANGGSDEWARDRRLLWLLRELRWEHDDCRGRLAADLRGARLRMVWPEAWLV